MGIQCFIYAVLNILIFLYIFIYIFLANKENLIGIQQQLKLQQQMYEDAQAKKLSDLNNVI
jgi:hypothetical protein